MPATQMCPRCGSPLRPCKCTKAKRDRQKKQEKYERQFGDKAEFIRGQPCCGCGEMHTRRRDPHHLKNRLAPDTKKWLVPLCRKCHNVLHYRGQDTFERERAIDLWRVATDLEAEYRATRT